MPTHSHQPKTTLQPQSDNLITEKEGSPIPIILIGMNRSGTTWLSNILSSHTQIKAIRHKDYFGILETSMFNQMKAIGDISNLGNYIALMELWSATDFFKLAGVDKSLFYKLRPRPTRHVDLFSILMRTYAAKENASFWLQKISPITVDHILPYLPESRIIIIRREILATLRSTIALRKKIGVRTSLILSTIFYVLQDKILCKTQKNHDVIFVRYEDLRARTEEEVNKICSALQLDFEQDMLKSEFQKNTSFPSGKRETFPLSSKIIIRVTAAITSLVPLTVLWWLRSKFRRQTPFFFPSEFYQISQKHGME